VTVPGSVGPVWSDEVLKKKSIFWLHICSSPSFCISKSICLDHDHLQSKVTHRSFVSYTCSTATLFNTRFSGGLELNECFVPNTMLLVCIYVQYDKCVIRDPFEYHMQLFVEGWGDFLNCVCRHIEWWIICIHRYTGFFFLQTSGRSFVKIKKSSGPSEEPYEIPHCISHAFERLPLKKTFCVLLVRELGVKP